jgi:hypothetical protein
MVLVSTGIMQSSSINLPAPVINDLKDARSDSEATTMNGDTSPFGQLFSSVVGAVRKASQDTCAEENELDSAKLSPDNLPPALHTVNVGSIVRSLAANDMTAAAESAQGNSGAEGTDERGVSSNNLSVTSLVMGMLSLAVPKIRENYLETGSLTISLSPGSEETDTADSAADTEGDPSPQADSELNSEFATEDRGVAESLALLLVSLFQTTPQERSTIRVKATQPVGAPITKDQPVDGTGSSLPRTTDEPHPKANKTSVQPSPAGTDPLSGGPLAQNIQLLSQIGSTNATVPESKDSSQSYNQAPRAERPVNSDRGQSSSEVHEDLRFGGALSREHAGKSIEDVIMKLETLSDLSLQDKDTDHPRLGITAVRSSNGGGKTILMVPNSTANFGSDDRLGGVGGFTANGAYDVDRKITGLGTFIEGASSKTMPVIGQEAEGTSSHNDGGERRESGPENHAFLRADQVLSEGHAGQQKGTAPVHQAAGSAIERFERFERIAEQIAGKSGSRDLTVRLDIGNEETVVVGLKDLGQSVAVEVRASHQGLINLLQSQKESIVRHLEGKDVRTSFLIDPNASRTPDRRDRRETKRHVFTTARRSDKVFGTFLDTFA